MSADHNRSIFVETSFFTRWSGIYSIQFILLNNEILSILNLLFYFENIFFFLFVFLSAMDRPQKRKAQFEPLSASHYVKSF